ncbi:MAG: class I SAM-dependent methyltransferase [Chthoniobacterales bacterium]
MTDPAPRSLAFSSSREPRFWWHHLPRGDYVPPLYANLSEQEWQVMQAWFEETNGTNLVGECAVPIMSLLQGLVMGSSIRRIVQLGTHAGYSALLLGFFLRQMGASRGLCTFEIGEPLRDFTCGWIERAGLSGQIHVELRSSLDPLSPQIARDYVGGAPELIFIDSSHEYASTLAELEIWYPELAPGGLIVLHDTSEFAASFDATKEGGVRRALQEWRLAHPEAETFSLNHNVPAMVTPEMIYRDFCGVGLVQKPLVRH